MDWYEFVMKNKLISIKALPTEGVLFFKPHKNLPKFNMWITILPKDYPEV